jgi:hypothetical protein
MIPQFLTWILPSDDFKASSESQLATTTVKRALDVGAIVALRRLIVGATIVNKEKVLRYGLRHHFPYLLLCCCIDDK